MSGRLAGDDPGDRITVTGLRVETCHGVLPHEKLTAQPFLVDLDLTVDLAPAGASDDLGDTVSYADVAHDAAAILTGPPVDLIEHLAERIADACLTRPGVQAVTVTVHKPEAPIGVPATDAAVTVRRVRNAVAVIGLGGNLSAPVSRLADAVRRLAEHPGLDPLVLSPLLETDPVGGPADQASYANAVVIATTSLSPTALLRALQAVEAAHGRVRDVRWGPRTLDLDLLSYADPRLGGQVVSASATCTLPHPRAAERAFVVVPWLLADPTAELALAALPRLLAKAGVTPPPAPASKGPAGEESTRAGATSAGSTDGRARGGSSTGAMSLEAGPAAAQLTTAELHALGVRPGPDWPAWVSSLVMVAPW